MASDPQRPDHWVDELLEKHECGPYRDPVSIPFEHEGRPMTLIAPWEWEGPTEVVETTISASGDLLYMVARESDEEAYLGFNPTLIVARRRGTDCYEVVVWHQLCPWAIERLGLGEPIDS